MTQKVSRVLVKTILWVTAILVLIYLLFAAGFFLVGQQGAFKTKASPALRKEFKSPQKMVLLDTGADSFIQRLQLIRSAQKTIELEFFIFDLDIASRITTAELIEKAKLGVNVRILVDSSIPVFRLTPAYAQILRGHGIHVKYYNYMPIYRFISSQHRSHRKLLIVDDKAFITGGRNVAKEYFDMKEDYNFIDSDILVRGEMAQTARESFDQYFNSELTEDPNFDEVKEKHLSKAKEFLTSDPGDDKLVDDLTTEAKTSFIEYTCNDSLFITDPPAGGEESRQVFKEIVKLAIEAQENVVVESPYFVIKRGGYDVLKELSNRQVHLEILTNSAHSTDAIYAVSSLMFRLYKLSQLNLSLSVMTGAAVEGESSLRVADSARWGLHSKRAVIDHRHTLVGTYNVDPRSANLNSELMVVCRDNKDLADAVFRSFQKRKASSEVVIDKGELQSFSALYSKATITEKILLVLYIPVANLFDFLL
ncbi:MAG: phosphatidylserine/phosphatidylglycerophosphate/cardiolipin synthase family protein [Bdellovibrionales bacterium]|nr:phosphatidylserine/phosphatidylglycerophosphate/cardiolipin synthase family protein [Bdellovibrionales bacterium]